MVVKNNKKAFKSKKEAINHLIEKSNISFEECSKEYNFYIILFKMY